MTCDRWHVTCDMWHMTHDTWYGVIILSKFQLSSSNGLGQSVPSWLESKSLSWADLAGLGDKVKIRACLGSSSKKFWISELSLAQAQNKWRFMSWAWLKLKTNGDLRAELGSSSGEVEILNWTQLVQLGLNQTNLSNYSANLYNFC